MDDEPILDKPLTFREKWLLAVIVGVVAIIAFGRLSYIFSDRLSSRLGFNTSKNGKPTSLGFTLHIVFFILIIRILMR